MKVKYCNRIKKINLSKVAFLYVLSLEVHKIVVHNQMLFRTFFVVTDFINFINIQEISILRPEIDECAKL